MFVASTTTITPPDTGQDPPTDIDSTLITDLAGARQELADARQAQLHRDSPENGARVTAAAERIDSLLDLLFVLSD